MLEIFLSSSDLRRSKLRVSIQETIVEPALDLAHKMHLSANSFELKWTKHSKSRRVDRPLLDTRSCGFECIQRSGKSVKPPAADGRPMMYLFDHFPALIMQEAKTDGFGPDKVLKIGKVLVAFPKEEDGLVYSSLKPNLTWLGHLNDVVHGKQAASSVRQGTGSYMDRMRGQL